MRLTGNSAHNIGVINVDISNINYKEQQKAKYLFRDYWENFISSHSFAEHHGLTLSEAWRMIDIGREVHNRQAAWEKSMGLPE